MSFAIINTTSGSEIPLLAGAEFFEKTAGTGAFLQDVHDLF